MKRFLYKYTNQIAILLVLLTGCYYFLITQEESISLASSQFQHAKAQLEQTLESLEILGFADTMAVQKGALQQALEPFLNADYPTAEGSLKQFVDAYPEYLEAQYYLGLSLLYQEKKTAAKKVLYPLSVVDEFIFREDADWFALLASTEDHQSESLKKFQKIAASPTSKYQQAAATVLASLQMNPGEMSFKKTEVDNFNTPQFALIVQKPAQWWQNTIFRNLILLLLPLGGLLLIFWKKKVQKGNKAIIEKHVVERTASIQLEKDIIEKERDISEELLNNILPAETARELKLHGQTNTRRHEVVTVLFCDFQGFTKISEEIPPEELVNFLGTIFEGFDLIIGERKLEKIKTVGDCYICAGGLKEKGQNQVGQVILAAQQMVKFLKEFNENQINENKPTFNGRIGINTGPVVAGIVGIKKYSYDIWGDTVNIAARMEQSSQPGRINVSGSTHNLIKNEFNCEYRGKIEAKGKGAVDMYFIN